MRDSYFETGDTLRPDRLPSFRTELNFRPGYDFVVSNKHLLVRRFIGLALPAVLSMTAFRLIILISDFGIETTLAALIVLVVSGLLIYEVSSVRLILMGVKCACAAWLLLVFLRATQSAVASFLLLFIPAVVICGWYASRVAFYAIVWMSGHPLLKPEAAQVTRMLTDNINAKHHLAAGIGIAAAMLVAQILSVSIGAILPVRAALLTVLLFLLSIAFLGIACVRHPQSITRGLEALLIWFEYREHSTAPGQLKVRIHVLSFPWPRIQLKSTKSIRVLLPLLSLSILGIWTISSCAFCPVLALISDRWLQSHEAELEISSVISEDKVFAGMTRDQKTTFYSLSDTQKEEYVRALGVLQSNDADHSLRLQRLSDQRNQLNSRMDAWVACSVGGLINDHSFNFWMLGSAIFCCIALPPALFISAFCLIYGRLLDEAHTQLEKLSSGNHFSMDEWSRYVSRIQNSNDTTERESLWLGLHAEAGYPVLLHREILHEHAHILGCTGSGKSALGIAPLISQLISASGRDYQSYLQQRSDARTGKNLSSVVVIDLKGDPALFHGAQIEAREAGLPFRWFTNLTAHATYIFNPFLQQHMMELTPNQRTEIWLDSLGLSHGDGYGRSYYSRVNRRVLSRILTTFGDSIDSFAELKEYIQDDKLALLGKKHRISKKEREDAAELFAAIESLAAIPALNVTARSDVRTPGIETAFEHRLDMYDVCSRPMVVYFYLSAAIEATSVKEIGQLALFSLLSAAVHREAKGLQNLQTYLFIDEFQQIVGEDLEIVLRQARSKRIAAILANQNINDLTTATADLVSTVQGNTRFKQFFAATEPFQQNNLIEASGETIEYLESWTVEGNRIKNGEIRQSETVVPRITRNDVIAISDRPDESIVQISRGKGFAQFGGFPFALQSQFHISAAEYQRRANLKWPQHDPERGTILPGVIPKATQKSNREKTVPSDAPSETTSALAMAIDALAADRSLPSERNEKDA